MRRHMASFALMLCGALAFAFGLTVAPSPTTVSAMPALQPSPRPTLEPTPEHIPDDDDDEPTPIPFGRVTGTVIDQRTGAPAANVQVMVGDSVVTTDGSGNYDTWVPVGSYRVALQLRDGEGAAAQGAQEIGVSASGTTVLHLFFMSPAPPTEVMPEIVPTPVAPPPPAVTEPEPVPPVVAQVSHAAPSSLPHTAIGGSIPTPVFLVGALLFGLGALLQLRPRRRGAPAQADERMLRRMLAEDMDREK